MVSEIAGADNELSAEFFIQGGVKKVAREYLQKSEAVAERGVKVR